MLLCLPAQPGGPRAGTAGDKHPSPTPDGKDSGGFVLPPRLAKVQVHRCSQMLCLCGNRGPERVHNLPKGTQPSRPDPKHPLPQQLRGWVGAGQVGSGPPCPVPPSLGIQSHWCRPAAAALSQFTRKPSREGSSRLCSERPQERLLLAGLMILPPPTAGSPSLPEGCPGLGLAGGEGRENLWDRGWVLGVQRGTQPCFVFISPSLT